MALEPRMPRVPMQNNVIAYRVLNFCQTIYFSQTVVDHFNKHRQRFRCQREAGGQLFARIIENRVLIEIATGPRKSDHRTRFSYLPDRHAENDEISTFFGQGLHYVGDWHTHPIPVPVPSPLDEASISECFAKSSHNLNGFLLVIIGTMPNPRGWHVSIHDGHSRLDLTPESSV